MPGVVGDRKALKDKLQLWVTGCWVKCLVVSGMVFNFEDGTTRLSNQSQNALTYKVKSLTPLGIMTDYETIYIIVDF